MSRINSFYFKLHYYLFVILDYLDKSIKKQILESDEILNLNSSCLISVSMMAEQSNGRIIRLIWSMKI